MVKQGPEQEMTGRRSHWDGTYTTKADHVSWYQDSPARSLAMIREATGGKAASVIDIGGGASRLPDALLAGGYSDITVLDVSAVALSQSKARLGAGAARVTWIVADITTWQPERTWQVWHDRAVFHFLVEKTAQDAYLAALRQGTEPGSAVVMATFALTGPEKCSGLPVQRYSVATLADRLGPDFALTGQSDEKHPTPFGTTQDFTFAAFRRR